VINAFGFAFKTGCDKLAMRPTMAAGGGVCAAAVHSSRGDTLPLLIGGAGGLSLRGEVMSGVNAAVRRLYLGRRA
jgi:hypothetical protein